MMTTTDFHDAAAAPRAERLNKGIWLAIGFVVSVSIGYEFCATVNHIALMPWLFQEHNTLVKVEQVYHAPASVLLRHPAAHAKVEHPEAH